eukprot:1569766-Rhodomonas_salina.6
MELANSVVQWIGLPLEWIALRLEALCKVCKVCGCVLRVAPFGAPDSVHGCPVCRLALRSCSTRQTWSRYSTALSPDAMLGSDLAAGYVLTGTFLCKARYCPTPRNPAQETASSVRFVPGMRFLVFDFGVQVRALPCAVVTYAVVASDHSASAHRDA